MRSSTSGVRPLAITTGLPARTTILALSNGGFVVAYANTDLTDGFHLVEFFDKDFNGLGSFKTPYTGTTDTVGRPSLPSGSSPRSSIARQPVQRVR